MKQADLYFRRVVAFIFDFVLIAFTNITGFILSVKLIEKIPYQKLLEILSYGSLVIMVITFTASFLFKDSLFKNRSLGKLIFGICIVNDEDQSIPSSLKLVIRNATNDLFLLEFIIMIINNGKRFGDKLTETKVIRYRKK